MNSVEFLLVILTALGISAFATKRGIQPGVVVVLVGSAVSFLPFVPRLEFSSHLILATIMPPLLFSAARDFPISRFSANARSIFGLGVTLVVISTVVVAFASYWYLPALTLSGAFVLAAIVSPPDTITTVVHGREFGLTTRCVSILTGESIVNDAAALTLFTAATLAVTGSDAFISNPLLLFAYAAVMGWVVGAVFGHVAAYIRLKLDNPSAETVVGILLPFVAYMAAEEIHASGVLAVVMSGFTLAAHSVLMPQTHVSPETRVQESAVWPAIDTLLESVVFAFIGLQANYVLDALRTEAVPAERILTLTALIFAVLVVVRMAWVFLLFAPGRHRLSYSRAKHRFIRADPAGAPQMNLSRKEAFLIGWTGMRGIVTIGAAAALPATVASGGPFPAHREIQTVAYLIAFSTLIIQASLLPIFARRFSLDLVADEAEEMQEISAALAIATQVGATSGVRDRGWYDACRSAVAQAVQRNEITDHAARVVIQGLDHGEIALQKRDALFASRESPVPYPGDE